MDESQIEKWEATKLVNLRAIATITDASLLALGVSIVGGIPAAASVFLFKVACFYHDKKSLDDLKNLNRDLGQFVKKAKEKETLIDFTNEDNLWGFYQNIEKWLEQRFSSKRDLLRRVVLSGVIKNEISDELEKDFKFVIGIIEMEDIEVLKKLKEEEKSGRDRHIGVENEEIEVQGRYMEIEELGDNAYFKCGRLQSAGLIRPSINDSWATLGAYAITEEGKKFLEYLQAIDNYHNDYFTNK